MTLGTHTISSNDSVNCDDCKEVWHMMSKA
jgi:hypothetical protein